MKLKRKGATGRSNPCSLFPTLPLQCEGQPGRRSVRETGPERGSNSRFCPKCHSCSLQLCLPVSLEMGSHGLGCLSYAACSLPYFRTVLSSRERKEDSISTRSPESCPCGQLQRLLLCKHAEVPCVLPVMLSQRHDRSGELNPEELEISYF